MFPIFSNAVHYPQSLSRGHSPDSHINLSRPGNTIIL